jgi:acetyltransferase-like isoleucine patch superfamily enzyme
MNPQARILLGDRVGLSSATIVAGNSIHVGSDTLLGAGCMVLDNDFHAPGENFTWKTEYSSNSRPVSIGRGCFIGARAIILKGVTLGDRVVVGAGAVVTRSFPSGSVIGGNPASLLQSRPESGNPPRC